MPDQMIKTGTGDIGIGLTGKNRLKIITCVIFESELV
jgi:hypothetical protein